MIWINIDRSKNETITRQLYNGLTDEILKGKLSAGYRLPPTRKMSRSLGISRNIVIEVYEQLRAEGFLTSKEGSGTFVAEGISTSFIKKQTYSVDSLPEQENIKSDIIHFDATTPDMSEFPKTKWASLIRQAYIVAPDEYYGYSDMQGIYELREAISGHLKSYKGLECSPNQIIITLGSTQAFDIIYHLINKQIDTVAIEDPSYLGIFDYFDSKKLNMLCIDVDKSGMVVESLPEDNIPKLVCITPSHQYPTGSILSIQRRMSLFEYASRTESYIIENDYGGDYNYLDVPMKSCHSINPNLVFHVGTFSKSLFPSLRIGYLVVPQNFIEKYNLIKCKQNIGLPVMSQYALSLFIKENHYIRHLSKMNKMYQKKRKLLQKLLLEAFGQEIKIMPSGSDYYIVVSFSKKYSVQLAYESRKSYKTDFILVENMAKKKGNYTQEVLLGYGALSQQQIIIGVERLKELFNQI